MNTKEKLQSNLQKLQERLQPLHSASQHLEGGFKMVKKW